ncbi:DUF1840 domain-containing protein [Photobacterium damselae]|uniref:DUF1840 domain-containing protein n=1 Tax=Photobacterium damselae TaxID=38293 RepID=UPI0025429943
MLIQFSASVCGSITMFGEVGETMIKAMGFCQTIPGAITELNLTAALENLMNATVEATEKEQKLALSEDEENDEEESFVPFANRARPLIDMLETCVKEKCPLMWDKL